VKLQRTGCKRNKTGVEFGWPCRHFVVQFTILILTESTLADRVLGWRGLETRGSSRLDPGFLVFSPQFSLSLEMRGRAGLAAAKMKGCVHHD
jgi:hypothetical protein